MAQGQTVQGKTSSGESIPVKVDSTGQVYIANPGAGGGGGNLATAAKGTTAAGSPTSTTASADRQPLDVTLRDTAGNAVSVGGGTQYADGAARGTATGTIMMVDDGTNIQSAKGDSAGRLDVNVNGTVPVSGTFFQATQPVSLATAPTTPVTGAFFQATQPVSGTVTVSNPTTNPETGLAKDGTDITTPTAMPTGGVGIRGWLSAIWTKLNGSLAVTGTFFQATQPVSGTVTANTGLTQPLTDAQLRLTPVPVSGTVSTGLSQPLTDTQLRATPVPVSGTVSTGLSQPLTDTQLRASAVPVSLAVAPTTPVTGTFFQATQPVSLATAPTTPVTGTFFQATQPVSLATNTPTLQSGSTTAVTQATAANLNAQTAQIATVIPTATTMQNAAVAVGNGTNLNVLGYVSAIISITGTMGGGTRIDFEASVDDVTFVSIAGHQIGVTGNLGVFTTGTGDFRFSIAAYKSIRARVSTYGTGTITAKGYVSAVAGHGTTVNANIIAALPTGAAVIGALTANQSVNKAQVNGVTIQTGTGVAGTGTQRVAVASDSSIVLATGAAVIGTLTANQSVNNAQINGIAPLMGNGVTGTGSQRMTLVSDGTAISTAGFMSVKIDQTTPGTTNNVALQPSNLLVTATAAISTAVTLTLPAVASQFHYITAIEIHKYAGAAVVGAAAPVVVTSTNLPGSLAWTTPTAQAVGTSYDIPFDMITPLKSSVVNTATTIVCPLTTSIIWRVTVTYYTAA